MKYRSFALALMAMVLTGCQSLERDILISEESQFSATVESFGSQTKTSMSAEKTVLWSSGDRLAIFQGATIADEYQVTESSAGKTNGTFNLVNDNSNVNGSFSAGTELLCNVALYPYAENLSLSGALLENEGVTYTINGATIPATQTYTENSFANGSFPMVAVTQNISDHTLKFKNVLGAMKLQLKGTQTVKSIKVAGKNNEKLSGAATIPAYSNNLTPAITMTGEGDAVKSVTLDCGAGVQLNESTATDFIIALPPVLFTLGFTVTVTDSESQTYEITTSAPNTILRSSILVMPVVTLGQEPGDSDDDDDELVIPVEVIELSSTSLKLYASYSSQITATVRPNDATNKTVVWSSSHPAVATVDQNGRVTGVSVGTATISATAGGVVSTCSVTVKSYNPVNYVDENHVNYGQGIVIGGTIWAPVNCGYEPANGEYKGYPYGKLYQWGRKYGQGYDSNDATTPTFEEGGVTIQTGSHSSKGNVFFSGASDWVYSRNDQLWNSGTEESPVKTEYDPCPTGWRVPTYAELNELRQNRSALTTNSVGQNGCWFSGPFTYSDESPRIFLPAAGNRRHDGSACFRGDDGYYWSSRPDYDLAYYLTFYGSHAYMADYYRARGYSVRCVQE